MVKQDYQPRHIISFKRGTLVTLTAVSITEMLLTTKTFNFPKKVNSKSIFKYVRLIKVMGLQL